MAKFKCVDCKRKFNPAKQPGALLISPPKSPKSRKVKKYHVCTDCWTGIAKWWIGML